jgi:hypothetical protein
MGFKAVARVLKLFPPHWAIRDWKYVWLFLQRWRAYGAAGQPRQGRHRCSIATLPGAPEETGEGEE